MVGYPLVMTPASTTTLTDFLLARLDEDEAVAREWLETGYQPPAWGPEDQPAFIPDFYEPPTDADRAWVARVLATVAAHRAIVALHTGEHECVGEKYGRLDSILVAPGFMYENDPTLCALAAVYADHEDYLDEWKP
jgi:hypothetical protein